VLKGLVASLAALALLTGATYTVRSLELVPRYGPIGRCVAHADTSEAFSELKPSGTVVGLAASGGGSRAAYLAAAVLAEMRRSGIRVESGTPATARTLLEQLDAVSAVSGGSLAAAYFVANDAKLTAAPADSAPWKTFLDKMALNFRLREWYGQALMDPHVWAKYLFSNYDRGLLAREDYDTTLYRGATLADLPDRPALYLNAFDVTNHVRFIFSKDAIDTWYYQPRDAWGMLAAPQELTSENDLSFIKVPPKMVRIADAVGASSAFPFAYPNVAIRHCGSKILFQGSQIFLADGALADNSGLLTLLTQLRAALAKAEGPHKVLVIAIDSSLDRLDTNGTRFQQRGDEDTYAWQGTIVGHGVESVESAVALMQDLGWKFLESTGVETDQINANWPTALTKRSGACHPASKASWENMLEDGRLSLRPLVVRLGLRDVMNPDFEGTYGANLSGAEARLQMLVHENGITGGWRDLRTILRKRLAGIPTDFVLTTADRQALDLAAFLLVHGKLAGDIAAWNAVARAPAPAPGLSCP
jgi:predicted acylesterase/phospholipase RssA